MGIRAPTPVLNRFTVNLHTLHTPYSIVDVKRAEYENGSLGDSANRTPFLLERFLSSLFGVDSGSGVRVTILLY